MIQKPSNNWSQDTHLFEKRKKWQKVVLDSREWAQNLWQTRVGHSFLGNKDNSCVYFITYLMKRLSCAVPEWSCYRPGPVPHIGQCDRNPSWVLHIFMMKKTRQHQHQQHQTQTETSARRKDKLPYSQSNIERSCQRNSYSPISCGSRFFSVSYFPERSMSPSCTLSLRNLLQLVCGLFSHS